MTVTAGNSDHQVDHLPPDEPVDLFSPEVIADPFGWYARIREAPTVMKGTMMGGPQMWLVTRYEDVAQVLTDPRFLTNPPPDSPHRDIRDGVFKRLDFPPDLIPWMANLLNVSDGEDHTRLRKLVSYALTAHRVGKLRPRVEEITANLLDELAEAGQDGAPVDLVESLCYPLPVSVICELVGIDIPDRPHWRAWGDSMATMNGERIPATLLKCIDLARDLIERRRAEPHDDLVTALVQAQAEDESIVSDNEIIGILFSLVTAGHQTTTYLIGNSVLILLEYPDQLARLQEDPSLWPQAVRELQRLGPIQFAQPRFPAEDIEIGGVTIPAGAPVAPLLLAANTDPRKFPDPNTLRIDRLAVGSESHLGFGKGIHRCLGQHLAYQEAEVALHGLFTRFPNLSLAVPREEIPWILRPGFTRTRHLPLRLC
jgi:cytochrome P450